MKAAELIAEQPDTIPNDRLRSEVAGEVQAAKFTKGPWSVLDHQGVYVLAEGGLTVAMASYQIDYAGIEGRVQIENARLIAAAPDMFAALQKLHDICTNCDLVEHASRPTEEEYCAVMDAAEAALARATGGQS